MATRVFLLSGDEKAVHAITQILDEQDIRFEHSSDSAFTLKRLAAQHFDLLVVDCDNTENATQVFNSARASYLNKGAIAIAIVEGKAGVPNAFRLGASLVLTKPVSLEQVRNTLRTGIGMSRKDTAETKPAAPPITPASHAPAASVAPTAPAPMQQQPSVLPPVLPPVPQTTPAIAPLKTPAMDMSMSEIPVAAKTPAEPTAASPVHEPEAPEKKAPLATTPVHSEPAPKPLTVSELKLTAVEEKPAVPVSENKPSAKVVDFASSSHAKSVAAQAPSFTSLDLLSDLRDTSNLLSLSKLPAPEDPTGSKDTAEASATPAEETAASLRADAIPAFGGLAKQPFAGIEAPKRNWTALIAVGAVVVITGGFAAAWFYAPGFQNRVLQEYSQVRGMITGNRQTAVVTAPKPAAPVVPQPQIATSTPPTSEAQPSNPGDAAAPTQLAAQPADASKTASTPGAPPSVSPSTPQGPSVKPATAPAISPAPAPAVAKPNADASKGSATLMNAAATTLPSATAPKPAPDILEVPEDYADDQVIHRIHPTYPRQARTKKIQGTVVLQAIVDKQGKVDSLQLVSGDPLLAQAAADAVKQWRYKPYSHNGEPAEFQTRVTVDFKLP